MTSEQYMGAGRKYQLIPPGCVQHKLFREVCYSETPLTVLATVHYKRDGNFDKLESAAGHWPGTLIHTTTPFTWYVQSHMVSKRKDARSIANDLTTAPTLQQVTSSWIDLIKKERSRLAQGGPALPVVIAGHNAHAIDFKPLYWGMLEAQMAPYDTLKQVTARSRGGNV
jgi:hypothetical protein